MGSVGVKDREPDDLTMLQALRSRDPAATPDERPPSSRARAEAASELVRRAPPMAPDAQPGQRLAMPAAPSGALPPATTTAGAATLLRSPVGDPSARALAAASAPEAQWPELKVGQGVVVETRDRLGGGYKKEMLVVTSVSTGHVELRMRAREGTVRVDSETFRSHIGWQYGHETPIWHTADGDEVSWTLKTEPNLTAPEPPAVATETMRALMRTSAQRFDATVRAALADPKVRERWERVMALQGRYRELTRQRSDLELGLAAHLAHRPLRISQLVGRAIPSDEPGMLREVSEALARDPVEAAFRGQMSAIDDQMVDVGKAGALVSGDKELAELAATTSDPLVLAMSREAGGRTVSAATLLATYLDNADAALARGSTSGALIATSAALQPFIALDSERHGNFHRLPPDESGARRASLTMAMNQLIMSGSVGNRALVHSSEQLTALTRTLSDRQLVSLQQRLAELNSSQSTAYVSAMAPPDGLVQRRERRIHMQAEIKAEVLRLEHIETSDVHRDFLQHGGRELLSRADALTQRILSTARADELVQFGRGVADVFDSLNTWVMAGTMLATRGIGAATFARNMPQLGELLLAYRAGRLSRVAMQGAATKLAVGAVGTAATFTSLNNLALDSMGEERYVDWSPAAFATNLLALTAFDYIRARSFVRNFETAPALHGSLGLNLHKGRLFAQQAAEQFAGMNAIGLGSAYLRAGNLEAAEQVLTANVQFLIAMAAVGKLGGSRVVVPEEVARIEKLLRDYRQLPASATAQRKSVMEEALDALRGVADENLPGRSAQLAVDVLASSRVRAIPPNGANVPLAFSTKARALIDPLMRPEPFAPPKGPVSKPGKDYVAVFPGHPLDGDSVLSALATLRALRAMGVEAYMAMSQPMPRNLREHAPRLNEVLENPQLVFAERPPALAIGIDSQHFFGRSADAMPASTPMLRIDHHKVGIQPSAFMGPRSSTWVDMQAQSSGQLVGDLIDNLAHSYARTFKVPANKVLSGPAAREIVEPMMVATYTDVWGGAARPLVSANDTTIGVLRYLSQRADAGAAFAKLGGQLPVEVRKAVNADQYTTFVGGAGAPRSATEVHYPFENALALLERMEGSRRGFDHHRDLKGRVLDHLDGFAQGSDVVFALVPEASATGIAGTRFFLRSYAHGDGAELTDAIRSAAARRFPEQNALIDAGGKQFVGGGWMPLTQEQMSEVMRGAISASLSDRNRSLAGQH